MKSMERCEGMQQSVRGGQKKILTKVPPDKKTSWGKRETV